MSLSLRRERGAGKHTLSERKWEKNPKKKRYSQPPARSGPAGRPATRQSPPAPSPAWAGSEAGQAAEGIGPQPGPGWSRGRPRATATETSATNCGVTTARLRRTSSRGGEGKGQHGPGKLTKSSCTAMEWPEVGRRRRIRAAEPRRWSERMMTAATRDARARLLRRGGAARRGGLVGGLQSRWGALHRRRAHGHGGGGA